jgi:hypothetical protein
MHTFVKTNTITMKKILFVAINIAFVGLAHQAFGQSQKSASKKHSIEASLFGATQGFYKVNYVKTVSNKNELPGQLVIGVSAVPNDFRDKEGTFTDVSLWLGYRKFLWKGLHAEIGVVNSYARVTNNPIVNDKTFSSYGLSNYGLVGYQFNLAKKNRVSYYFNVQPLGFYFQWIETDKWPGQDDNQGPFLGLDFGIKF